MALLNKIQIPVKATNNDTDVYLDTHTNEMQVAIGNEELSLATPLLIAVSGLDLASRDILPTVSHGRDDKPENDVTVSAESRDSENATRVYV